MSFDRKPQIDDKKDIKQAQQPAARSLTDHITEVKQFTQIKTMQFLANNIADCLEVFNELNANKDKTDAIKNSMEQIANEIARKLRVIDRDVKLSSTKVANKTFLEVIYDITLYLAKFCPRNTVDIFTLEPINEKEKVYTSDLYQFDISNLVHWINSQKGQFVHPYNKILFHPKDISTIKKCAEQHTPKLTILTEHKHGPSEATSNDIDAINALLAEDGRNSILSLLNQRDIDRYLQHGGNNNDAIITEIIVNNGRLFAPSQPTLSSLAYIAIRDNDLEAFYRLFNSRNNR